MPTAPTRTLLHAGDGAGCPGTPVVLHRPPGAFALPSCDPRGLAVETMLRITRVRYTKRDAHYRDVAVSVPAEPAATLPGGGRHGNGYAKGGTASEYVMMRGVEAAMKGLSAALDAEVVANDMRPAAACVEALATKVLFPAFVFLSLYDYSAYQYAIRKSVTPKVGTLWETVRGTFRMNALKENAYFHGDANGGAAPPTSSAPSVAQAKVMESVLAEVANALQSLELLHATHAGVGGSFFLGTAQPCSVDAYAYAGVSAFLHADFSSFGAPPVVAEDYVRSPILAQAQQRMREECPLLLRYVEKVRVLLFEDYGSTYNLKPAALTEAAERTAAVQAAHSLYAKGRVSTLLWTGAFAFAYFLVANADLLAAMAEELSEALGEEETDEKEAGEGGE